MSTISSRDMERDGHKFLSFWTIFCRITPLTTQKIKILKKKLKKTLEDIIIIHKCNKNHNHMPHSSWDMTRGGCNFYFSWWAIFLPFYPPKTQKIKIFKNWKKLLEISFCMCTKNYDHMMYDSWDMLRDGQTDGESNI